MEGFKRKSVLGAFKQALSSAIAIITKQSVTMITNRVRSSYVVMSTWNFSTRLDRP